MVNQTVMIVEDDVELRELMGLVIAAAGYQVRLGKDVLDLYEIEKDPPALILLDNWLDGKTGHDICFQLKSAPKTRHIPVILVSASPNLARTAESCRADDYIAKPFDIDLLTQKVTALIQGS